MNWRKLSREEWLEILLDALGPGAATPDLVRLSPLVKEGGGRRVVKIPVR